MKIIVNLVVEGGKDAYFLHEFLLQRYSGVLNPVCPPSRKELRYKANGETMMFSHITERNECIYKICVSNGYDQDVALKLALCDSDNTRTLVCTALIYDSDITGASANSGQKLRRRYLSDKIDRLRKEIVAEGNVPVANTEIFLFPDQETDGDIESVMQGMAISVHPTFFRVCWRPFQFLLGLMGYLRLSNKSMMYDYVESSYEKTNKIARVKDKQGYNKNICAVGLWDWQSESLVKLVSFIDELLIRY